jgi:hypothetical protein
MSRVCQVCLHPQTAQISRDIANAIPFKVLERKYDLSDSCLHRHKKNCLKMPIRGRSEASKPKRPGTIPARISGQGSALRKNRPEAHPVDGRCPACLTKLDGELSGEDLKRRGERLFYTAERIALKAQDSDNATLCLQALDRATRSFETLAKVAGLIGSDAVTINIHQQRERQAYDLLGQLTLPMIQWAMQHPEELRLLASNRMQLPAAERMVPVLTVQEGVFESPVRALE